MKKQIIQDLIDKVPIIESTATKFFDKVQVKFNPSSARGVLVIGFSEYSWIEPTGDALKLQRDLINTYEDWYSQGTQIIAKLIPDRRPDFVKLYEYNRAIIELEKEIWSQDKEPYINDFLRNLGKQSSIIKSLLIFLNEEETSEVVSSTQQIPSDVLSDLDKYIYIDLKAQLTILSQQYSRIETDIKDLAQKVEGIGRITINNLNNNIAKTGSIRISNENIVKLAKPEIDEELIRLKDELKEKENNKEVETSDKQILEDLIESVLTEKNPKIEWLKDKISKIKYWGSKVGLLINKLKEITDMFGLDIN